MPLYTDGEYKNKVYQANSVDRRLYDFLLFTSLILVIISAKVESLIFTSLFFIVFIFVIIS